MGLYERRIHKHRRAFSAAVLMYTDLFLHCGKNVLKQLFLIEQRLAELLVFGFEGCRSFVGGFLFSLCLFRLPLCPQFPFRLSDVRAARFRQWIWSGR